MGGVAIRWILLCTVAFLVACSQMIESGSISREQKGASCASGSVAYHLPRRKVEFLVEELRKTEPNRYTLTVSETLTPAGHLDARYCLRYASNAFSTEQIGVEVSKEGLLNRVYSDARDGTKDITLKLVEAATDLVASQRAKSDQLGVASTRRTDEVSTYQVRHVATYTVDPFDQAAMEAINEALWKYGYCVHLDDTDDLYVPAWSVAQCQTGADEPVRTDVGPGPVTPITPTPPAAWQDAHWGVLYRPNLTHRLIVRHRTDPQKITPWDLDQVHILEMPNGAPVFSVDVRRAIFADRQTTLTFDHGVLSDVTITKGSELNALADIPLQVAQFIVSIPAQVLQLRINRTSNAQEVIKANQQLLETYRQITEKKEKQEQLIRDAQICRAAASKQELKPQTLSDYLQACVSQLELCRDDKDNPKTDLDCAEDYWRKIEMERERKTGAPK